MLFKKTCGPRVGQTEKYDDSRYHVFSVALEMSFNFSFNFLPSIPACTLGCLPEFILQAPRRNDRF